MTHLAFSTTVGATAVHQTDAQGVTRQWRLPINGQSENYISDAYVQDLKRGVQLNAFERWGAKGESGPPTTRPGAVYDISFSGRPGTESMRPVVGIRKPDGTEELVSASPGAKLAIDGSKYPPGSQILIGVTDGDQTGLSFFKNRGTLEANVTERVIPPAETLTQTPTQPAPSGQKREAASEASAGSTYQVRQGDNMWKIWKQQAAPNGVSWNEFKAANAHIFSQPHQGNLIRPGDQVVIPRSSTQDCCCTVRTGTTAFGPIAERLPAAAPSPRTGAVNLSAVGNPAAHLHALLREPREERAPDPGPMAASSDPRPAAATSASSDSILV
ncbi:MAG: LysM peptidoglycan-binding domain-containing protein [Deltaproteobacteria bacterium]|nr:LysM peptidoglycan-binding domain-containing protein [Deltaproteobacteria bacterium]